jgi:hypothetical protein
VGNPNEGAAFVDDSYYAYV